MFLSSEIRKEIEEYSKLQIAPEHRKIVEDLANVVIQFLDIDVLALRGFVWRAMKKWQMEKQRTVKELVNSPPEERVREVRIIANYTKDYLKRVLKNRADEKIVDEAIEKAFSTYVEKWANR